MADFFQTLVSWIAEHPNWALAVVFLVAMAESLAIVGMLVPGVAVMFAIGALIAADAIAFWPAMLWAVAGAVMGDGLSFWLGRRFQDDLRDLWPFNRHPESLEQGIAFFRKYGGKSVAVGRFFGPVRAVIPLVAGMLGMPPGRFLVANVLSALAWAPAYLVPGMVFGASLKLASEVAFRLVALILLLGLLGWLTVWAVHRVFVLLHPHTAGLVQWILRLGERSRVLGQIAQALADPRHPETRGLALYATLLILATALFVAVLGAVLQGSGPARLDYWVLHALQSLRTPWADHLMAHFSRLGDAAVVYPLALALTAYAAWRGDNRTAFYWVAATAFCLLASPLLKAGLGVPRPEVAVQPPGSNAFPSGHALKTTVIYGFLAVVIARGVAEDRRWIPYSVAALPILAVGLARLYFGVHWLSDVIGGITLGLAWVAALGLSFNRHSRIEIRWGALTAGAALALLMIWGVRTWMQHAQDLVRYAPRAGLTTASISGWRGGAWRELPQWRHDLWAAEEHPLNVQYAGDPAALRLALEDAGWQRESGMGWKSSLKLLSPALPIAELPILPQVHDDRHEALLLAKPLNEEERLVLRLWPSAITLQPGGEPLYSGNVTRQLKTAISGFAAYAVTANTGHQQALERLFTDLGDRLDVERVRAGRLALIGAFGGVKDAKDAKERSEAGEW